MLTIRGIHKAYGNKKVLEDISLSISDNSCYAIVGKNGSGKSTLFNIIANLIQADKGEIELFGQTYQEREIEIKRRLGLSLEHKALIEEFSGLQYLEFVTLLYEKQAEVNKEQITDLFNYFFDSENDGDVPIGAYSTGMKQKIAFCAAIIHKPELLILDEPFSGLDPLAAEQLASFLKLYREGRTILIASHNLAYLEKIATHIGVLSDGKLIYNDEVSNFRVNRGLLLSDSLLHFLLPKDKDSSKVSWLVE